MTSAIRVLIAEDHLIARVGLGTIVSSQADMAVVGEASSGLEAVSLFRELLPDVTLMDIRMPIMGGIDAMKTIRER
jgi:YesN/AraC family two-component response regulator